MNIILVGYMGSGKSSIGQKLAQILNFDAIDFDNYIEEKEKMSIQDIFKTKGEIYFRKLESQYIKEVIHKNNAVISLGGGTPCYGNNMQLILDAKQTKSIYLKTSIPNLSERLFIEKESRPLISHIKTLDELNEFIGKHLFERSYYYNQSEKVIVTDHKSMDAVVEAILLQLF